MGSMDNYDKLIQGAIGKRFTISKAREFQKHLNTMPTGNQGHSWADLKTGATIAFTT